MKETDGILRSDDAVHFSKSSSDTELVRLNRIKMYFSKYHRNYSELTV